MCARICDVYFMQKICIVINDLFMSTDLRSAKKLKRDSLIFRVKDLKQFRTRQSPYIMDLQR